MSKYISQYTAQTTLSASDAFLLQRSNTYYQVTLANLATEVAGNINISDISDVDVTGIMDGDTLIWDAGTTTWLVGAGGGGASALDDLTDVTITTVASGNFLRYNGSAWVNIAGVDASYIGGGSVDNTEFGYLNGVTSAIQTQLNDRPTGVSGTANYVAKYTGAAVLANSQIQDDGTGVSIGSAPTAYRLNVAGTLNLEEGGIIRIAGNKWLHYPHNTLASTASHNIGLGYLALASITTGQANIAIGYQALNAMATGSYNTALGAFAGYLNATGGGRNTFIGYNSGRVQVNASDNTFVGHESGYLNTTGQQNTFLGAGSNAGTGSLTGSGNTGVGYSAAENINGASEAVTCLGAYSGRTSASTVSNAVMIGYEAKTHTSNVCVIGARTTARAYTTFILGVNDLPTGGGAAATTITVRPGLTSYASSVDETGHSLRVASGQATGTGGGASVADLIFATTSVTTTGTTLGTVTDRIWVKGGTGYMGINKSAPITQLHVGGGFAIDPETTKTSTYAATVNVFYIPCDADTIGAFDVDLPTAASASGLFYLIKKIDAGANAVTIDLNGADTVEGSSSNPVLADQGDTIGLYSNGTEWVYWTKIGV